MPSFILTTYKTYNRQNVNRNKWIYINSVDLFIFVEGLEIISTFTKNNYRQAFE